MTSERYFLKVLARFVWRGNAEKQNIKEKTEHLIELVLYNPRVSEHKDGQLTFNTWKSIAEILVVGKFGGKYKIHAPCILYIFL